MPQTPEEVDAEMEQRRERMKEFWKWADALPRYDGKSHKVVYPDNIPPIEYIHPAISGIKDRPNYNAYCRLDEVMPTTPPTFPSLSDGSLPAPLDGTDPLLDTPAPSKDGITALPPTHTASVSGPSRKEDASGDTVLGGDETKMDGKAMVESGLHGERDVKVEANLRGNE